MIWMSHPRHGVMPCSDNITVESNKKNGWSECDAPGRNHLNEERRAHTAKVLADAIDNDVLLLARYEAKFGKPPHHRMKAETIEAALRD